MSRTISDGMLDVLKQRVAPLERRVALTGERIKLESQTLTEPIGIETVFSVLSPEATVMERSAWAAYVRSNWWPMRDTDVDGKYTVEVPVGHYYLYAMFESSYFAIEWLVPVTVSEAKDISVDLHNENAVRMANKKD